MTFALELAGAFVGGALSGIVALGVVAKFYGPRIIRKKLQGAMLDFTPPKP